jgi:hypothetical protein
MPYIGTWGTFYHIPKCGGIAMRYYLKNKFRAGTDFGNRHTMPDPEHMDNPWTIVRHPAEWLLSYYSYIESHEWHWPERPPVIDDIFRDYDGMFWPMWVKSVTEQMPGVVGRVYGMYTLPGVKVYRMEEIDSIFGEEISEKNITEIKPVMTLDHWQMICKAERETLDRYGYDDKPTGVVWQPK